MCVSGTAGGGGEGGGGGGRKCTTKNKTPRRDVGKNTKSIREIQL